MIIIVNRRACPRRAIELIGHTTKDGVTTVGRFGSGTAYAVALAMRLGLEVTISSHDEDGPYEVKPYVKKVTVGDTTASQIVWRYRRGSSLFASWWDTTAKALSRAWSVPTSFSSELGAKDWIGAFPVVREFVSNARDADPEGFACWLTDEHLEVYLARAQRADHKAVTVVRIDNPLDNADAPESYIENWSDNFRWGKHNDDDLGEVHRDGMQAIYAKPEPSPLRLFVRGVRCPWPSDVVPLSMYDYSLSLELTEARTIKDQLSASTRMTSMWANAPRGVLSKMLSEIGHHSTSWEARNCNEFVVASHDNSVLASWRDVHGDSPVAGPSDPLIPGSVNVAQPMRDLLARNGVPTAASRVSVITVRDHVTGQQLPSVIRTPAVANQMVIAITMIEANRLLWLLRENLQDDDMFDELIKKLVSAGAVSCEPPVSHGDDEEPPSNTDDEITQEVEGVIDESYVPDGSEGTADPSSDDIPF